MTNKKAQTEQRARGRDAQRRYRTRKDQHTLRLQQRNEQLESIAAKAIEAFITFGDSISPSSLVQSSDVVQTAYRSALQTFQTLSKDLESDESQTDSNTGSNDMKVPLSEDSSTGVQLRSLLFYNWLSVPQLPDMSAQPVLPNVPITSIMDSNSPANLPPTHNGFMQDTPLWVKMLYTGLLTSYRAKTEQRGLESAVGMWVVETQGLDMQQTRVGDLPRLASRALEGLMSAFALTDMQCSCRQVFDAALQPSLNPTLNPPNGAGARKVNVEPAMADSGIYLRVRCVAHYLRTKGKLEIGNNHLRLHIRPVSSVRQSGQRVAVIEMDRFIDSLITSAFCLGDSPGFERQAVNNAVVSATSQLLEVSK
ncbi:uncharacterized protein HMPREF1541_11048 [Cyphellophora europaea CBS 101466]|uniref:BZIP domain-containing protein n=1 Tax=Cyphellophora europaea (strain CBS 101466) TaxID=1220924 RepID=W2S5H0_CYPE1|nr:uncharacterized protein HMPREF1541_11048 [Cyphellophora europaea CBS 101466]ETN43917.1 hypothetical protein HMPREF1541_11048 [Cyphellophora europaea CBS 101466]